MIKGITTFASLLQKIIINVGCVKFSVNVCVRSIHSGNEMKVHQPLYLFELKQLQYHVQAKLGRLSKQLVNRHINGKSAF